jgi:hypothetical protein
MNATFAPHPTPENLATESLIAAVEPAARENSHARSVPAGSMTHVTHVTRAPSAEPFGNNFNLN